MKNYILILLFTFNLCIAQKTEEVTFQNGEFTLSGTLYVPDLSGPAPTIVFLHGSGEETRKNSIYSAQWFASMGYVVLIYDKRGTGLSDGSKESWSRFSFNDLADDLVAAIDYLRNRVEVDNSKIGVQATSQGGWVVALATSKTDYIHYIIMKSASVTTLEEDRIFERSVRLKKEGFSKRDLEEAQKIQKKEKEFGKDYKSPDSFTKLFEKFKDKPWFSRVYASENPFSESLYEYRKWYSNVADFNPIQYLENTETPIFWIFGDSGLDHLSPVEISLQNIRRLRHNGKAYEIKVFEGEGHKISEDQYEEPLFQWLTKINQTNSPFIRHTAALWIQDFKELYMLLKSKHRNLYHNTPASKFEEKYVKIKNAIPTLNDHEIIVEFAKFVALVGDGHTRLSLPIQEGLGFYQSHTKNPLPENTNLMFQHLPVEFYWFDDGLYIIKASNEYQNLIGKEVLEINGIAVKECLERAREVSHYDTELGYRLIAASKLSVAEVLHALKITDKVNEINLTLKSNNSTESNIVISPLAKVTDVKLTNNKLNSNKLNLLKTKNDRYYWYDLIDDKKTLYVQINQMNNQEGQSTLVEFLGELERVIDKQNPNKLIVDLRNNFGGNNSFSLAIVNLILKHKQINTIGNLYTLIGRKTFSAAQYLANDLGKWTNTIFVGEPSGASPNSYGDAIKKRLSNSKLTVRISTIYWRDWSSDENKKLFKPDIPISNMSKDYFDNSDQAINECLKFNTSTNLVEKYKTLYQYGGIDTAYRLYFRIVTDWEQSKKDIKEIENLLVGWISQKKANKLNYNK